MNKSLWATGISLLFVVSALTPMMIGHAAQTINEELISKDGAFNKFDIHHYPEAYASNISIFITGNEVESGESSSTEGNVYLCFDKGAVVRHPL